MLENGAKAPAFTLKNQDGEKVSLSDLKGQKVVLYFYPKDDTPGCTKEAEGFKSLYQKFKKQNIHIFGVSRDDEASHQKFIAKYKLPFDLLCDPDAKVAEKYGAWGEKNMYGKKSMGIIRSTFVIDETGKVERVYKVRKADVHPEKVYCDLTQSA